MNRTEPLEKEFKRRYNRDVEIYRDIELDDKVYKKVTLKFIYKNNELFLIEHLTPQNSVDYVIAKIKDKEYMFESYLRGEVEIADAMGDMDAF